MKTILHTSIVSHAFLKKKKIKSFWGIQTVVVTPNLVLRKKAIQFIHPTGLLYTWNVQRGDKTDLTGSNEDQGQSNHFTVELLSGWREVGMSLVNRSIKTEDVLVQKNV